MRPTVFFIYDIDIILLLKVYFTVPLFPRISSSGRNHVFREYEEVSTFSYMFLHCKNSFSKNMNYLSIT